MFDLGKILIIVGIFLIFLGIIASGRIAPLGNLPGDILIERENFKFYLPITTMIIISLILSFILKLLK